LTRPAKDEDDSGGADSGGNPGTCEKKYHGSKAMCGTTNFTKKGMQKPRQSRKNSREPRELRETPRSEIGKKGKQVQAKQGT
jgi:hypothetical protein